jgi:hypothetical protein
VQKEIVEAGQSSDVRVYFVWVPMVEGDNEREAVRMERRLGASGSRHFYDPKRRTGLAYVEEHFQDELRQSQAALPEKHPLRQRLTEWAATAPERMLWDAVLFFAPGAEWNTKIPQANWWTRQINFQGPGERRQPPSQFLRNHLKDGPVDSDWFAEARAALKLMEGRASR